MSIALKFAFSLEKCKRRWKDIGYFNDNKFHVSTIPISNLLVHISYLHKSPKSTMVMGGRRMSKCIRYGNKLVRDFSNFTTTMSLFLAVSE